MNSAYLPRFTMSDFELLDFCERVEAFDFLTANAICSIIFHSGLHAVDLFHFELNI